MKILAVIGSPRKNGNTYRAVERIKENILGYDGSIEFECLFIRDYDLKTCTGCFACISKGKERCPSTDERDEIMTKMMEADGIIFAAPCYAMGVSAVMKNFIDRFAYTLHRPCFFDKTFMAVAIVGGVMGLKQTLQQLAVLSSGGRLIKKVGISCPPIPMAGFDKRAEKSIRKASGAFCESLKNPRRKAPGMGDWAYFNSFKAFTAFESYRKICPADYDYYSQRQEYFYPLKGHIARRLIGRFIKTLMRMGLKLLIRES